MIGTALALLWLVVSPAFAQNQWRTNGYGQSVDATPPKSWDTTCWSAQLDGESHSTPIVAGPNIIVTDEPTALKAFDLKTGALRWQRNHAVVDALDEARARPLRERLAREEQLVEQVRTKQQEYGDLRRELRKSDPTVTPDQLQETGNELERLMHELKALEDYRTPQTGEFIGWATPTPISDSSAIYALFANGVVAKYDFNGNQLWARWLGRHSVKLSGHDGRDTASLLRVNDLLIVPYGRLRRLI